MYPINFGCKYANSVKSAIHLYKGIERLRKTKKDEAMQTRNTSYRFWMAIAVLWLSACATTEPPPVPAPTATLPPIVDISHPRAKLIIGSSELLGAVELRNPIFRSVGQLTQAQVQLENYSDITLELEYKIDWHDDDGFKAGAINSWQFISLTANGSEDLTSTGKVPEATNITVTVRLPDGLIESTNDETGPEQ